MAEKKKGLVSAQPKPKISVQLDLEWLAILKIVERLQSQRKLPERLLTYHNHYETFRETDSYKFTLQEIQNFKSEIFDGLQQRSLSDPEFLTPPKFQPSQMGHFPIIKDMDFHRMDWVLLNPQTESFLKKLESSPKFYEGLIYFNCQNPNPQSPNPQAPIGHTTQQTTQDKLVTNQEEIDINFSDEEQPSKLPQLNA
jgi:hypothetical protein